MSEQGWGWSEPPSAAAVLRAAGAAQEAFARARASLAVAGGAAWVSSAATAYAAVLDDALADVARAAALVEPARAGVLAHVRAADAARALAAQQGAELRAGLRAMSSGWLGGPPGAPGADAVPAGVYGPPSRPEEAR